MFARTLLGPTPRLLPTLAVAIAALATTGCGRDTPPAPPSTTSTNAGEKAGEKTGEKAGEKTGVTTPEGGELVVGKPAPDFSAKAHDGTDIKVSALKGKPVVLYFYPKDETPGCTKEACSFRDAWKDLAKENVVLVGISSDNAESHKAFAKHHELPFHLVSDESGAIAKSFGVPNRGGFLGRQTIVIGADGNVKKIYREVDVAKHAAEILADVKS